MKRAISALAGALALISFAQAAQADDFSARRKSHSPFYTYTSPYTGEPMSVYRPNYLVPSNDFEGGIYAGGYAHKRAQGKCVIDLGYGRYENC